jgi:hypothetical protein
MVDRKRGDKSEVRLAKSSKEQDGYEAPDTTGARLKPGPQGHPGATTGGDEKIIKTRSGFKRAAKNFLLERKSLARPLRKTRRPLTRCGPPLTTEPNPKPSSLPPGHATGEAKRVTWYRQDELVWNSDRARHVESCAVAR